MSWLSDLFKRKPTAVQSPQSSMSLVDAMEFAAAGIGDRGFAIANISNTNSMLPLVDANAVVVLEAVNFDDVQVGDLITWWSKDGKRILHPVFEKKPGGLWTKGINNASADNEYVTRENFDKRVVAIVYAKHTNETRL